MLNSSKDGEDAHMNFGIVICFQFLKQFVNDREGKVWYDRERWSLFLLSN